MPGQLAKRNTPQADVTNWHDSPDGGARGIIAKHVQSPYIIDVDPQGRFDVFTLDKRDKPKFVTSGKANNVARAKSKATAQAIANIKELKAALQADIIDTKASPVKTLEQPAWVKTVKVFIALALFVFAFLLFARWLLLHRPVLFIRWSSWAGVSLFGAWRLLKLLEDLDKRRTRLSRKDAVQSVLSGGKK